MTVDHSDPHQYNGSTSSILASASMRNVQLSFAKKSLRELCESRATAIRKVGPTVAGRLRRRLADLRAAANVKDLVAGRPRQLDGAQHIAVDLGDGFRLVFCANHQTVPMTDASTVDWARVDRIQILRVENNDD